MLTVYISEDFKIRASTVNFKLLNKPIGNGTYNVNETKWYAPLYVKVCNLYYYESGTMLEAFGGMDNAISYKCKSL